MFTGIIEAIGKVEGTSMSRKGELVLSIQSNFKSIKRGESIAVDGVCLTVTNLSRNSFSVDVSNETVKRTTLKNLQVGDRVNLERSLKLGDRLGGHFVLGHVDGTCKLVGIEPEANGNIYSFSYPHSLEPYIVPKGSVAINGISLTIASDKKRFFSVAIVPYTQEHTSLKDKRVGDRLNLEADILTKVLVNQLERLKK